MPYSLIVPRTDLAAIAAHEIASEPLADGDARMTVARFGLSSNNISYALFGDALGYWAHFPVDDVHGCVPVWGFAEVTETRTDELQVGTRVFGYLPMASELVVHPSEVNELSFRDVTAHRAALQPWYGRYYRCEADPIWSSDGEPVQATMWALFMTGWALADQLAESARTVVVSSASSKTALSLAWTLRHHAADVTVVGVTSEANRGFVDDAGVYDGVVTYDSITFDGIAGPVGYVDAAGSPAITERIYAALGDRLTDSVVLGATHQGAGAATGDLVGPVPRFFFIPDVAEERAAADGLVGYHGQFAEAWGRFAPWVGERLEVEEGSGVDGILSAYRSVLGGEVGPETARVLTW